MKRLSMILQNWLIWNLITNSYFANVLVASIHAARLGRIWLLWELNRFLLSIPPCLWCSADIAAIIYRLLAYNTDFAVLRLWRPHRTRLYAFVTYIALRSFTSDNFGAHAISPGGHIFPRWSHLFILRSILYFDRPP
jgi:hypothetical protein